MAGYIVKYKVSGCFVARITCKAILNLLNNILTQSKYHLTTPYNSKYGRRRMCMRKHPL